MFADHHIRRGTARALNRTTIVLGVCLTAVMSGFAPVHATATTQAPQPFSGIYTMTARPLQQTLSIGGTVAPRTDVTLTAQLPGRIDFIAGSEGDHFQQGQTLVTLSDTELLAQRSQAEAQLASAYAALSNAGVQFQREWIDPRTNPTPGGMRLPSMMDKAFLDPFSNMLGLSHTDTEKWAGIYQAQSTVAQSRAAYDQALAQIQQIDAKLRDARSIAPFDGYIVRKYVEVGDTVQPGQKLLDFAARRGQQVVVQVPARLAGSLKPGQRLQGRMDVGDGTERTIPLTVNKVFPSADPMSHTVTVKLDLPSQIPVRPGTYASVALPMPNDGGKTGLAVPRDAVVKQGGLNMVYVVGADGRIRLRLVRLGSELAGNQIQVLAGLDPGERILRHPQPGLRSGQRLPQAEKPQLEGPQ